MTAAISVLIYAKNEQQDLPGCLDSLTWCDDIHVFDSMSTDQTAQIARAYGASVTQRSYPDNTLAFGGDESAHRNWALEHIPFRHAWIFQMDADERVTPELVLEMQQAVASQETNVAYRMPRRDYFMGRWLKHVTPVPFNIRLFRKERMRYERVINPSMLIDGTVGDLKAHFDHFPFSKGMKHWINKHNQYSEFEAEQIIHNGRGSTPLDLKTAFFDPDVSKRVAQKKELYYRLPCRPLVMFVLLYIFKRGFLDGRAGLRFCILRAMYEYMIVIKTQEKRELRR